MALEREERWTNGSGVQIGALDWPNITYYRSVFGFSVVFIRVKGQLYSLLYLHQTQRRDGRSNQ